MVLEFKNVCKSFSQGDSEFSVLNHVSFSVLQGEVVSLVAPSGAGKTTLLQIAGLLDEQTRGVLLLDGIDCSTLSERQRDILRRDNIGFIYQFHHLLPEFTALENVMLPRMIADIDKKTASEEAAIMLGKLDMQDRFDSLPSELSGGQQQRVAIARALINKPKILLADEPTGNLDEQNSQKVFDLLLEEVKERQLAAIVVTHNLELAKKTDNILTINKGQVFNTKV